MKTAKTAKPVSTRQVASQAGASWGVRRGLTPLLFVGPAVIFVIVIMVYPVFRGVWLSLHESNPFTGTTRFVGLGQFIDLFGAPAFRSSLRQSLILVAGTVVIGMLVAIGFAMVLDRAPLGRLWRTVILVPWLISGVAVATIWRALFSPTGGFADTVTSALGLERIVWFGKPGTAMFVIIMINVWSISPFSTLIIYTGLKTVSLDLYEAASIDGASPLAKFWHVTLPSIRPQFAIALVFLSFAAFNSFETILLTTGGGPARSTEVLAVVLFRKGFEQLDFNSAAAVMVVLLVINLVLSVSYVKLFGADEST